MSLFSDLPPAQVLRAFRAQESGGNPNARSVQDARGTLQITRPLFDGYARPGERFDRSSDVEAVALRAFSDVWNRNGGDAGRTATEWFSGRGNVNTGDGMPWKRNARDGNGKSVAGYVGDILDRLNPIGRAEASEPPRQAALPPKRQEGGLFSDLPPLPKRDDSLFSDLPPLEKQAEGIFSDLPPLPAQQPATPEQLGPVPVEPPEQYGAEPKPMPPVAAPPTPSTSTPGLSDRLLGSIKGGLS